MPCPWQLQVYLCGCLPNLPLEACGLCPARLPGFGGGWGRVQILRIMKDSRVGTYALVGMALVLQLKTGALAAMAAAQVGSGRRAWLAGAAGKGRRDCKRTLESLVLFVVRHGTCLLAWTMASARVAVATACVVACRALDGQGT